MLGNEKKCLIALEQSCEKKFMHNSQQQQGAHICCLKSSSFTGFIIRTTYTFGTMGNAGIAEQPFCKHQNLLYPLLLTPSYETDLPIHQHAPRKLMGKWKWVQCFASFLYIRLLTYPTNKVNDPITRKIMVLHRPMAYLRLACFLLAVFKVEGQAII